MLFQTSKICYFVDKVLYQKNNSWRKKAFKMYRMGRLARIALALSCAIPAAPQAAEWGCEVLLCLAAPNGPMSIPYCVPPIERLYRALLRGDPFPTCAMAEAEGSYARQVWDPYDPCPEGMEPFEGYLYDKARQRQAWSTSQALADESSVASYYPRACVAGLEGYTTTVDDSLAAVYSTVVWQEPQSPRAIDVYINGKFHTRVHY